MTTAQYRDEVDALGHVLTSWKSCATFEEREVCIERLNRAWRHMALHVEQPVRLPQRDKDRCQRLLNQIASVLNDWVVDLAAGVAQEHTPIAPPAKAMEDTMKFCNMMKGKASF